MNNNFKLIKTPGDFKNEYPLTLDDLDFVAKSRKEICSILCGNDPRLVIIVGPCSIHDEESAVEYAKRIKHIQERVKDHVLLVMRFYFEKPRTKTGWKGLLYDPHLDATENLEEGIKVTRRLMSQITSMGVPMASEIVDPMGLYYFKDLICWLCIGARTSSSQVHRQNASGMPMPVGFKNDLSGSISNVIHSIIATDSSHTYLAINDDGRVGVCTSNGAPFTHIVLRGSKNKPNYMEEHVEKVVKELDESGLMQSIVIDCSHDNCDKNHEKMPAVFEDVIRQVENGNEVIRGLMLESHILPGSQQMIYDISRLDPRISITDPCIGWEKTEELIDWAHQRLSHMNHVIH